MFDILFDLDHILHGCEDTRYAVEQIPGQTISVWTRPTYKTEWEIQVGGQEWDLRSCRCRIIMLLIGVDALAMLQLAASRCGHAWLETDRSHCCQSCGLTRGWTSC
jgi:hypothetical protein